MMSFNLLSDGPERTGAIACALAPALRAGDVILLTGGLATGKTTFVRAVAVALGSPEQVTSPTFSIAHAYSAAVAPVLHIDAYRLSGVHEFRDLGLDEYIEESITLIEWGDIVAEDFPCHLLVGLACEGIGADDRLITLSSDCDEWLVRLPALHHALAEAAAQAEAAVQPADRAARAESAARAEVAARPADRTARAESTAQTEVGARSADRAARAEVAARPADVVVP